MSGPPERGAFGARTAPRPTTLSARAARKLADGPLDALALMRHVCQVDRLQGEAAERMAVALLGSHPEFRRLASGHWALVDHEAVATPPTKAPPLLDAPFAVVDVETTGTRAGGGDRITEIAIVTVRGGEIVDRWSRLVNPERAIPPAITALTQITWAMVRDEPPFRAIAGEVTARLTGTVFTAHNAPFDWRFVSEELRRGTGAELSGPRLCTVRMARALLPSLPRRSLDHLTRYFGITIDDRHRALGDALATAEALRRMLRIAEQEGIGTWSALEARLGASRASRGRTASDRRRRAFPMPASEDVLA